MDHVKWKIKTSEIMLNHIIKLVINVPNYRESGFEILLIRELYDLT